MLKRAVVIVIDALGIGALPDAPLYGDSLNVNTLGNIDACIKDFCLPNMESMGLGNIIPMKNIKAVSNPCGSYGKMAEKSKGKDTTTGHWEMMGICLDKPFPLYPDGFPNDLIEKFIEKSDCKGILGNIPASGTEIIERFGEQHLKTGYPIIYTSADSVFQIASNVEKIPLETLYMWCEIARDILKGEHEVARVIARPFKGQPGGFERIGHDRKDYAVSPPSNNVLEIIKRSGGIVLGVGKIEDIFCGSGLTHSIHTSGNSNGLQVTCQLVKEEIDIDALSLEKQSSAIYDRNKQFIFVNLVDTDMKYGHRRDVKGYAQALEEIDQTVGKILKVLKPDDLLIITGDHGCDPTTPGSDHTREHVPVLLYSPSCVGRDLGVRESFADIGKTVLDWLDITSDTLSGNSMLNRTCSSVF